MRVLPFDSSPCSLHLTPAHDGAAVMVDDVDVDDVDDGVDHHHLVIFIFNSPLPSFFLPSSRLLTMYVAVIYHESDLRMCRVLIRRC